MCALGISLGFEVTVLNGGACVVSESSYKVAYEGRGTGRRVGGSGVEAGADC